MTRKRHVDRPRTLVVLSASGLTASAATQGPPPGTVLPPDHPIAFPFFCRGGGPFAFDTPRLADNGSTPVVEAGAMGSSRGTVRVGPNFKCLPITMSLRVPDCIVGRTWSRRAAGVFDSARCMESPTQAAPTGGGTI